MCMWGWGLRPASLPPASAERRTQTARGQCPEDLKIRSVSLSLCPSPGPEPYSRALHPVQSALAREEVASSQFTDPRLELFPGCWDGPDCSQVLAEPSGSAETPSLQTWRELQLHGLWPGAPTLQRLQKMGKVWVSRSVTSAHPNFLPSPGSIHRVSS